MMPHYSWETIPGAQSAPQHQTRRPLFLLARLGFVLASLLSLPTGVLVTARAPDFGGYRPHYQGSAVYTPGGRGGLVNKVTKLTDDGSVGTLRWAVAGRPSCANTPITCARFVVFETSGLIRLTGPLFIDSPFITIAGQTAPAPGITVSHRPVWVRDVHDVVIQHLRFRLGDTFYPGHNGNHITNGTQSAALYLVGVRTFNIVVDHVSISWATATAVTVSAHNVAFLDSIVADGLNAGSTETGAGLVWVQLYQAEATFARNLTANVSHRQPWVSPGTRFSGYNNVAYNSHSDNGNQSSYYGFMNLVANNYPTNDADSRFEVVWMNNVAIAGPDTHPATRPIKVDISAAQAVNRQYKLYLSGNTGPFMTLANQWGGVFFTTASSRAELEITDLAAEASWHTSYNYSVLANGDVEAHVLANAGARPAERSTAMRDDVDQRVTQGVSNRTGGRIVSQNDVGGYPSIPVYTRTYTIPLNPNGSGTCGATSGKAAPVQRTTIECDLEDRAQALEPARR
jgi:hypothetical protein